MAADQQEAVLKRAVQRGLDNYTLGNATFLAERLLAVRHCAEHVHLLATCYYRAGDLHCTYNFLQPRHSGLPETQYLFAKCCYDLDLLKESEVALAQIPGSAITDDGDSGAGAAYCHLYGLICRRTNRRDLAIAHFKRSLQQDPLMWDSYEALCSVGADIDAGGVFSPSTASQRGLSPDKGLMDAAGADAMLSGSPAMPATAPLRRSARRTSSGAGAAPLSSSSMAGPSSSSLATAPPLADGSGDAAADEPPSPGLVGVMKLLATLGNAFRYLSLYRCQEALDTLSTLDANQFETGWVLCTAGKAHYELVQYKQACLLYERAISCEPHRLDGLETYSSILWQLKRQVQLCYLAQRLSAQHRVNSITCCVLGNCFSADKEHETAIKFFERATQIDPYCTYAYTLCGHEYVQNEDLEKALTAFRNAIRIDERHYNAWYGLGNILYRQEKYKLAAIHFQRAIQINPGNAVLHCHLGMVLHDDRKQEDALSALEMAIKVDPNNVLAHYKQASVLASLRQNEAALEVLEQLQHKAPKEASVHFMMGKIFKRLGNSTKAMQHFSLALELHPKNSKAIKDAMENMDMPDQSWEQDDMGADEYAD